MSRPILRVRLELFRRRRSDWRTRMDRQRLRAIGHTRASYEAELMAAASVFCMRWPWRALPETVALRLFPLFGRRFVARWLATGEER